MKNFTLVACLMLCLCSASADAASALTTTAATPPASFQELQAQLTAQLTALQQEEQLIQKDLQALVKGNGTTASATGTTTTTTTTTAPQNVGMLSYNGRVFSEVNGTWQRWNGSAWVPVTDTATTTKLKAAAAQFCTASGTGNCIVTAGNSTSGGTATTTGATTTGTATTGTNTTGGTATGQNTVAPNITFAAPASGPDCWADMNIPTAKSATTVVGTTASTIKDAKGGVWSLTPQATLQLNGQPASYTQDVVQAVNVGGTIYQQNADGYWWSWNGTDWANVSAAPALTTSTPTVASGITAPTSFGLTDATGNKYVLQCGQVLLNGKATGNGLSVALQNANGSIMAQGTNGSWQQWAVATGTTGTTGTTAPTTGGGTATTTGGGAAPVNSGNEVGNSNNGSTTDTSSTNGNTGGVTMTGTSTPASGTGAGGTTTGTATTTTPKDPGTGVTVGVVSNCGAGMSPSGTTIPSAALITDCQGNVWTLAGGIPSMNQNPAGALTTASLLLLYNGNLYAEDASKIWWQWNSGTASWIQLSADPRLSANNGGGGTASGGCGSSNGRTSATAPTTNLCTTGTASVVASATGSWNWSCSGSGGGTVSQCFALKPNTSGQFSVVNGQIIAPNGQVFIARGINVSDDIFGSTTASGAPITTLFPNINFLRLAIGSYDNGPAYYQDFVSKMTALGIVVEFDDHYNGAGGAGGGQGVIFTGSQLSAESSWFNALATAFANNPYVWFGTNNEPSEVNPATGQQDPAALSDWQLATYNAIRGAGNNSIIMVEMNCGPGNPGMACGVGYRTSDYAGMTNIIWDSHYYGWVVPNESSDQGLVDQTLAQEIAATQQITSADGKVPVLIGEYGPSTDGQNRDPNGMQVVMSVINSGYSSAAWHWCPHAPDDTLTDCNGNLTQFGQMVSGYISSGR